MISYEHFTVEIQRPPKTRLQTLISEIRHRIFVLNPQFR